MSLEFRAILQQPHRFTRAALACGRPPSVGAYVFYGFKEYPIAFGMGYTRVKSIESPDRRVRQLAFLIVFDMPLFTLH